MAQILIIDDDPGIQILLKRTLVKQGYEVTVASDGEDGLAKAEKILPALVICDWLMPRMNGLEVCRRLKAMPAFATTFFILLTSLDSVADKVKGLDAGADDFLCKPIEMYELQARVRAGLRLHQLSEDLKQQKHLLESELAEAAEYVCSILPEPMSKGGVNIDVRFIPSRQLGGDSFDFFWLDEDHLVIYLLDVAGHGLRAALPSLSVINLMRSCGLPDVDYYQPSQVLHGLNQVFQMTDRNDKYFTIWYGVYQCSQRKLVYASAGHPPAILISTDAQGKSIKEVQRLKTRGFPIGMFAEAKYIDKSCFVPQLSTLFIFSDGVYEINQSDGSVWSLDAFIEQLQDCQKSHQKHLDQILQRVQMVNPNTYFDDDFSLIKIDFT
jgi:sigma-B regulation protein RsbU (phosphoserine phosphatase)